MYSHLKKKKDSDKEAQKLSMFCVIIPEWNEMYSAVKKILTLFQKKKKNSIFHNLNFLSLHYNYNVSHGDIEAHRKHQDRGTKGCVSLSASTKRSALL